MPVLDAIGPDPFAITDDTAAQGHGGQADVVGRQRRVGRLQACINIVRHVDAEKRHQHLRKDATDAREIRQDRALAGDFDSAFCETIRDLVERGADGAGGWQ